MTIIIYSLPLSAPCRLAYMTCELLGISYEKPIVDVTKGEQMEPWFKEINPQHNIPTIRDGDFVLNECRAIATYLINEYGKEEKGRRLYPKDLRVRARIDQRLHFDAGVLSKRMTDITVKGVFQGQKVSQSDIDGLHEALVWSDDFVKETGYVAGTDHLTLADVAFVATYSTVKAQELMDHSKYPNLEKWFEKIIEYIPNYEIANGEGAKSYGALCAPKLKEATK